MSDDQGAAILTDNEDAPLRCYSCGEVLTEENVATSYEWDTGATVELECCARCLSERIDAEGNVPLDYGLEEGGK